MRFYEYLIRNRGDWEVKCDWIMSKDSEIRHKEAKGKPWGNVPKGLQNTDRRWSYQAFGLST